MKGRTAQQCSEGAHPECAHAWGFTVSLFGKSRAVPRRTLCACTCHSGCPLAGEDVVPASRWDGECICPGADEQRRVLHEHDAERDARDSQTRAVFRDVHPGRGKSAPQIQAKVLAAHESHGVEPTSDYARLSRFLAAGTARRGRRIKLTKEAALGLRDAKRWIDANLRRSGDSDRI